MRASVPALLIVLLAVATLAGCGLKDDLYLPPPAEERSSDNDDEQNSRT